MKVTILIQDLFGQGAQYAMAAVARGLAAKGCVVELLISRVHYDYLNDPLEKRKPFKLPENAILTYLPSRRARGNIWAVRRYLRTTDSLAVMSTSGPYHKCLRLAALGLRHRPLLVNVDHGNWGCTTSGKRITILPRQSMINKLWTRFFFGGFDRKFFVNEASRKTFLEYFPFFDARHAITVYNPVIDDLFREKLLQEAVHPWLRTKKLPTFVAAGAYQPYKDHMTLLRAFREVVKHDPARLIIYGKGPLEKDYRSFIADNHLEEFISVAGYTNNLPAEMKSADGFILSSYWESFGIVIAEALACGLPVISTDAPFGPAEILQSGRFGTLVPIGDSQKMADAIIQLIRSPKVLVPDEAWRPYTVESVASRYLDGLRS